jgi:hypothetical protein
MWMQFKKREWSPFSVSPFRGGGIIGERRDSGQCRSKVKSEREQGTTIKIKGTERSAKETE